MCINISQSSFLVLMASSVHLIFSGMVVQCDFKGKLCDTALFHNNTMQKIGEKNSTLCDSALTALNYHP